MLTEQTPFATTVRAVDGRIRPKFQLFDENNSIIFVQVFTGNVYGLSPPSIETTMFYICSKNDGASRFTADDGCSCPEMRACASIKQVTFEISKACRQLTVPTLVETKRKNLLKHQIGELRDEYLLILLTLSTMLPCVCFSHGISFKYLIQLHK